jgi:hypothetical protein
VFEGYFFVAGDTMKTLLLGVLVVLVLTWSGCGTGSNRTSAEASTPQQSSSSLSSSSSIMVTVSSPQTSSSVATTFPLAATANSANAITGWQVYLDSASVYTGPAAGTINTNLTATQGTHQLMVRAWDTSGASGDQTMQITVQGTGSSSAVPAVGGGTNGLPTPPSTATVFSNIDQMTTGWDSCETAACAGGNGTGTLWQTFNQSSPSMDGNSMEIYHDGAWGNALWWHHMGANDNVTNLLWDFYVQLDSASLSSAQALEYDAYQFVGGYNYMIGTECNYAAGVWDTWSEANGQWLHTSIPCQPFAAGTWHHIQWYMTTNHSNHSYTYVTLVVDGTVYNLNQTQYAKNNGWSDNLGAQWQLDVNASGGGYHEWVDQANLTVW